MQKAVWNGLGEGTSVDPFILEVNNGFDINNSFDIKIESNFMGWQNEENYFKFSNSTTVYLLALIIKDRNESKYFMTKNAIDYTFIVSDHMNINEGPFTVTSYLGVPYLLKQQIFTSSEIPEGLYVAIDELDDKINVAISNFEQEVLKINNRIDKEKLLSTNILDTNADIVFDNEVISDRRFRGWKAIGEVPHYLRKDEIGTNRIQGSALVGDEIYWIGGTSVTSHVTATPPLYGASNKNISYNLKTNTWKENLDLPCRKDAPTLVAVGTDIYILGSIGRTNKYYPYDSVFEPDYKYDTLTNTYEEINSLQDDNYLYVSIQSSGADHLDGKIYISGRYWFRQNKSTNAIDVQTTPRLAIYDIATDTWEFGPTPPMSNDGGSSKILDRKFYVYRNTLYAYDIDTDMWSEPLNVSGIESRSHTSMAVRDGKLYVIGGYISGSSPVRTSGKTYVYDPILDEWEEDADLLLNNDYGIGIAYLMAVVWEGKLVVYGGTGKDENIYGPETNIENQFANWYVFIEDYRSEKDLTIILDKAKDYTYSKVVIDNKDTAIMNKANNLENANMLKDVNYNNVNGVLTFTRYDNTTKEIDLPLELIVTSGYYDEVANELVLVLANGSEIRIPVGNLLTDLDAHNIRFNGSGTNYLVNKLDVESAVKELDTRVKDNTDDLNAMPYYSYALNIYGAKYSLLANAWKHSLAVEIANWANYPNGETEGVIIPHGITYISYNAFDNWWSNNQPLVIPNSVTSIGGWAFYGWSSNNQPLVIPYSVTNIDVGAFQDWSSNNQPLIISQGVTYIGNNVFDGWSSNNWPLVIPNSVTSIGSYAFYGWRANNQLLIISSSLTSIDNGTFQDWSSNNQPLVIPGSVMHIGYNAFDGWSSNNQQLVIPSSVVSIGGYAFYGWSANNRPLVISEGVTSIDNGAFQNWNSNNHPLIIPSSVTHIGHNAFNGWGLVPYVEIRSIIPPSLVWWNAFDNQNDAPIYVPDESVNDYKTATNWVDLANRIFPISDKDKVIGDAHKISFDGSGTNYLTAKTEVEGALKELDTQVKANADGKLDKNPNITGATKTKITYDSKGLVTAGADLVEADIPALSASKITQTESARFVTDTQISTWNNKVDKIVGKGLSTEDYTSDEKNKLSGIEAGAEVNEVNSVNGKQGAVVLNQDDIGDGETYKRVTDAEKNTWNDKQDKLVAGDNINIVGNTISADYDDSKITAYVLTVNAPFADGLNQLNNVDLQNVSDIFHPEDIITISNIKIGHNIRLCINRPGGGYTEYGVATIIGLNEDETAIEVIVKKFSGSILNAQSQFLAIGTIIQHPDYPNNIYVNTMAGHFNLSNFEAALTANVIRPLLTDLGAPNDGKLYGRKNNAWEDVTNTFYTKDELDLMIGDIESLLEEI